MINILINLIIAIQLIVVVISNKLINIDIDEKRHVHENTKTIKLKACNFFLHLNVWILHDLYFFLYFKLWQVSCSLRSRRMFAENISQ